MRGICAGTYLLDDGENPGLAVVIAVRADTEVDLLGEGIRLEVRAELEDAACMTIRDREPSKEPSGRANDMPTISQPFPRHVQEGRTHPEAQVPRRQTTLQLQSPSVPIRAHRAWLRTDSVGHFRT